MQMGQSGSRSLVAAVGGVAVGVALYGLYRRRHAHTTETPAGPTKAPGGIPAVAEDDSDAPAHLICPITKELMRDPVFTSDGHTCKPDTSGPGHEAAGLGSCTTLWLGCLPCS
jgi:hypothetical protein